MVICWELVRDFVVRNKLNKRMFLIHQMDEMIRIELKIMILALVMKKREILMISHFKRYWC